MEQEVVIAGLLTERDVKRLAQLSRGGVVGPTAVYYAGVTGPMVSAGTALVTRQALQQAGMSDYWQLLLSTLIAALAGIAWYLIFIRWSYRHRYGRGTEIRSETEIVASARGLTVTRGDIKTQIGWPAVNTIETLRNYTVVTFDGADALIVPDRWFGKNSDAQARFRAVINERV